MRKNAFLQFVRGTMRIFQFRPTETNAKQRYTVARSGTKCCRLNRLNLERMISLNIAIFLLQTKLRRGNLISLPIKATKPAVFANQATQSRTFVFVPRRGRERLGNNGKSAMRSFSTPWVPKLWMTRPRPLQRRYHQESRTRGIAVHGYAPHPEASLDVGVGSQKMKASVYRTTQLLTSNHEFSDSA